MACLGIIAGDEEERERLALLAGEAGHEAHAARALDEAFEILRERRPRLMLVTDGPGQDAEQAVRELLRVSPFLPIVVAQTRRDASRAVRLLRTGACEVVAPPWTRESLHASLSKSLRFQGTEISVVQYARPKRHYGLYVLTAALLFGGYGLNARLERRARAAAAAAAAIHRHESWELPYRHPAAIAFDGKDLNILDWFTQSLYVQAPPAETDAQVLMRRLVHFPAESPLAVTFGAESAWSVYADGTVARHMKDQALTVVQKYPGAAPDSLGIAFDGLYLWTCDRRLKRIHKHLVDDRLSELASYSYPGKMPAALVFDGQALWSLDGETRELLRHNLERPDEVIERVAPGEYRGGGYKPVGLTYDGERLWTVAERLPAASGPARLYRHSWHK